MFRGAWTDGGKAPFVHIFPYWDHSEGEMTDVRVASNMPRVALYLNGRLIKEQTFDREHGKELLLDVKLPYEKGELKAVGCDSGAALIYSAASPIRSILLRSPTRP